MKKILFSLILLVTMAFIVNPVYAADTVKQVDIGSFDVWKNSSGAWIPSDPPRYTQAYKPGDTVHVTYTVTAPADKANKVAGVKSVSFVTPDNAVAAFKDALSAITYFKYDETYSPHQVNQMSSLTFNYTGNGVVEIKADAVLTGWVEPLGNSVKKVWQGQNVDGRQFYIPAVIEWELADAAPDFWITSPNGTSFTGEPGSTITIPTEVWNSGEKKDTTDFISWWDGESWDNKVAKYDNLTLGYGEKADTPVTVTVPTTAQTLWFRCNIDNNTPAGEADLTNNTLSVTVGPTGVDLALFMDASPPSIHIPHTMKSYPGKIRITAVRNGYEYETNPVNATITVNTPFGTKTFTATGLKGGDMQRFTIDCPVSTAGNYVFNGIIEPPSGLTDTDPSNNKASCAMVVTKQAAPETKDGDSDLPVGLTG